MGDKKAGHSIIRGTEGGVEHPPSAKKKLNETEKNVPVLRHFEFIFSQIIFYGNKLLGIPVAPDIRQLFSYSRGVLPPKVCKGNELFRLCFCLLTPQRQKVGGFKKGDKFAINHKTNES